MVIHGKREQRGERLSGSPAAASYLLPTAISVRSSMSPLLVQICTRTQCRRSKLLPVIWKGWSIASLGPAPGRWCWNQQTSAGSPPLCAGVARPRCDAGHCPGSTRHPCKVERCRRRTMAAATACVRAATSSFRPGRDIARPTEYPACTRAAYRFHRRLYSAHAQGAYVYEHPAASRDCYNSLALPAGGSSALSSTASVIPANWPPCSTSAARIAPRLFELHSLAITSPRSPRPVRRAVNEKWTSSLCFPPTLHFSPNLH